MTCILSFFVTLRYSKTYSNLKSQINFRNIYIWIFLSPTFVSTGDQFMPGTLRQWWPKTSWSTCPPGRGWWSTGARWPLLPYTMWTGMMWVLKKASKIFIICITSLLLCKASIDSLVSLSRFCLVRFGITGGQRHQLWHRGVCEDSHHTVAGSSGIVMCT